MGDWWDSDWVIYNENEKENTLWVIVSIFKEQIT